jgi:hypothetical protein
MEKEDAIKMFTLVFETDCDTAIGRQLSPETVFSDL